MIQITEPIIDKKELLLATAERLFAERDFDAVSVRDLADAAGTNVAMISYYFGSKEKLFEALLQSRFEISLRTTRGILESEGSPMDKLDRVIDFYVDKITSNRPFHKIIAREMSVSSRPRFKELIFTNTSFNRENIRAIIEDGCKKKVFRKVDIDLTIMTVIAIVSHVVGSSHFSCQMFKQENEDALYTPEFKTRIKTHIKEMLAHHLLIKQTV